LNFAIFRPDGSVRTLSRHRGRCVTPMARVRVLRTDQDVTELRGRRTRRQASAKSCDSRKGTAAHLVCGTRCRIGPGRWGPAHYAAVWPLHERSAPPPRNLSARVCMPRIAPASTRRHARSSSGQGMLDTRYRVATRWLDPSHRKPRRPERGASATALARLSVGR